MVMRKTKMRRRVVAALAVGALALTACGSPSGATKPAGKPTYQLGIVGAQNAGKPVQGGTLTVADYAEGRSVDPSKVIATAYSGGSATAALYDVLVRYNPQSQAFEPWLAEGLEHSPDYTTWTLKLRDGVKFSNGEPFNAPAVVNSVNWYMKNKGYDTALLAPNLKQVRAEGDRTVVFELNKPWSTFPAMLGQGAGMVVAPAATKGEFKPIGAGPFVLDHYSPQEELVLAANKDYWGDGPHLDKLRFVWLAGDDTKLEALNSGDVDLAVMREQGTVQKAHQAGLSGYAALTSLGNMLMLNQAEGRPTADIRIRQAIDHAIDPKVVYERAFEGAGLPSKSVFQEMSKWHADGVKPLPFDTAKARKLLDEVKAGGFDGKISLLAGADPASRAEAMTLKAMLERAGFSVNVEVLRTIADRIKRMYIERNYDVAIGATSVSEEDPFQRLYSNLHSKSRSNALGYADSTMDSLIDQLQQASGAARADIIAKIEQRFQETVPALPLGPSVTFSPWSKKVHGVVPINEQMLLFGQAWKQQ